MTQINLLPWREQLKQEMYLRYAFSLSIHLLFVILIVILINIYLYALIHQQQSRNKYLEMQLGFENSKLISLNQGTKEYEKMLTSLNILLQLKETSYQAVRQLDELIRVLPSDITLSKITRQSSLLTLTGVAKSNLQITQLMRNVAASTVFKSPDLTQINVTEADAPDEKHFVLNIQTNPMVRK